MAEPLDSLIAQRAIAHGINLLRYSSGVRNKVLAILERMAGELTERLLTDKLAQRNRARIETLLQDTNEIIERYYADIGELSAAKLAGVARTEGKAFRHALRDVAQQLGIALDATLPSANMLEAMSGDVLIQKATSRDWWKQRSRVDVWRFKGEVQQGMAQGETNAQIVQRITGSRANGTPAIMEVSKADAARLVHTSVQTVANTARAMTFQQNRDILAGIMQVSTLDGRTTDVCLAYSGAQWDMDYQPMNGTTLPYNNPDGTPGCPRHWNCRSVMIPVTKTYAEMGIDLPEWEPSTRAATGGPVRADMTMKEWLATRTDAQLNDQLGKGRADLYRRGVITLQQLLDTSGNPLSLAELEALYA